MRKEFNMLILVLALAAAGETQDRLRSSDQGVEDALMGFITSGPRAGGDQSTYDTGYREEQLRRTEPQEPRRDEDADD